MLIAFLLHLADRKREREDQLLIELPEFKAPSAHTIAIYVWEKVKDYLTKAGTIIFLASIIMWFLLNFGPAGYSTDMADTFGSILGKWIVPFFAPIGLGYWQIVGGPHRRHLRQRGGGLQLRGALRYLQRHLRRGHGPPSPAAWGRWASAR